MSLESSYFWFRGRPAYAVGAASLAVIGVIVGRRVARGDRGMSFYGVAIGVAVGWVVATAIQWALLPEAGSTHLLIQVLDVAGAAVGGYFGSYVPILRPRSVASMNVDKLWPDA